MSDLSGVGIRNNNKISKAGVEAVVLESALGRAIESAVDAKEAVPLSALTARVLVAVA